MTESTCKVGVKRGNYPCEKFEKNNPDIYVSYMTCGNCKHSIKEKYFLL